MAFQRLVVPAAKGGWNVLKPGAKRASSHHLTRSDATRRAWEIVHNHGGGEIVLLHERPRGTAPPRVAPPPVDDGRG
jgi:hypothetical protein